MTRTRRIIAAAVQRLRGYLVAGGRPWLTRDGRLSVSSFAPGHWRRGTVADQAERERAVAAFYSATGHPVGMAIIVRAIRMAGVRQPLGHVIMGAE